MTACKRNQECERKCKAKYKVCENRCAQEAGIDRPGGVMPAPK